MTTNTGDHSARRIRAAWQAVDAPAAIAPAAVTAGLTGARSPARSAPPSVTWQRRDDVATSRTKAAAMTKEPISGRNMGSSPVLRARG